MGAAIVVERFSKRYGERLAVDDVSLEVRRGEVFGLLGPNGAGKSTIVRALVGLHAPTSGRVEVAGFDLAVDPVSAKERLGYVPEVVRLYEALTPREHLILVARLHRLEETAARAAIDRQLGLLDLAEAADRPITSFSKGMKQKVVLAAALLPDPEVLILDEPLSGLDAETTLVAREVVLLAAAEGRAVLFTSHVMEIVEKLCTRIAILVAGRVAALGSMEDIRAAAGSGGDLTQLFATLTRSEDPAATARALLAASKGIKARSPLAGA
jgi:ABC-2 type transport system ATP-binding protein